MKIIANGVSLEVETHGPALAPDGRQRPVVLLIMGLGMQLTAWPPALIEALVDAGCHAICFDNRDVGLSQQFDHLRRPNLVWQGVKYRLRLPIRPPYSLHDMAADALGVLDALEVGSAHVVGVSMGGMIAQRLALLAPTRVASLASIMSSSGARKLPAPEPAATRAILGKPANGSTEAAIEHTVKLLKTIGSSAMPMDDALLRQRVRSAIERNYSPDGIARQMVATVADSARAAELARISAPTLVVHGSADPLVPVACGKDTAARIPGARLEIVEGMGHDLSPGVLKHLLPLLVSHIRLASAAGFGLQPVAA